LDETILWDALTAAKIKTYKGSNHGDIMRSFSKSGKSLALGDIDKQIQVIDLYRGNITKILVGHENSVSSAVFGDDDQWIASVSRDGTARVWDFRTGEQLQRFDRLINEAAVVSFEANDTQILVSSRFANEPFKRYALSPTLGMSTLERRSYVCETALFGAQEFRPDEMNDVILRGEEDLRNPCQRRGPLSITYYVQTVTHWWEWLNSAISSHSTASTASGSRVTSP
jgi:hypothetical protein